MLDVESLEHYFKPEVRKQGLDYFADDAVFVSNASDTSIAAIIKATPPIRISFSSDSISSKAFRASCTCSASGKGQFCKHIWATIMTVGEKHPDFFDSKTEIEKVEDANASKKGPKSSARQSEFQAKLKTKQSDYRKQQYQKQKARGKSGPGSSISSQSSYGEDVAKALQYFSKNGFEMKDKIDEETLRSAKKLLSRVFHPDKGGSHAEMIELNQNFDIVLSYLEG